MKEPADMLNALPDHHITMVEWMLRVVWYTFMYAVFGFLMAVLSACGPAPAKAIKQPPVAAHCDEICYTACTDDRGDTGIRWEGDPAKAETLDGLDDEVIPELAGKLRTCETRRKACVKCLDNLESQKVITR